MKNKVTQPVHRNILLLILFIIFLTKFPTLSQDTIKDCFSLRSDIYLTINIEKEYSETSEIYHFTGIDKIFGLTVSCDVRLENKASLARIILVDDNNKEYLVYEAYPMICRERSFTVTDICEETCMLDAVEPKFLKVEILDAGLRINNISISFDRPDLPDHEFKKLRQQIIDLQNDAKTGIVNERIVQRGMDWTAGKTDVSHLSYMEKKTLIEGGYILNLQGFEYYKGGVFEYDLGKGNIPSSGDNINGKALIEEWDWRERHGANDPSSPYYDGDSDGGGWFTSIKSQQCNQCWSFVTVGTIEVLTNLYFNQHIDLNLSEQHAAACSNGAGGSCDGGTSNATSNYAVSTGIVDESCMPYQASDNIPCSDACSNPTDRIQASGRISIGNDPNETTMKQHIMDYGPVCSGVQGMWHFMCLGGFYKDSNNDNVWIFKNSWGTGTGDNGFSYIKITGSGTYNYLYGNYAFVTPLGSIQNYEVQCLDLDGDGYYNWGIGSKPPGCPDCPDEPDGDDSDPCLGPLDPDYYYISLTPVIATHPVGQTVNSGQTVTFNVIPEEDIIVSYQWKKNNADIPGANEASYTIQAATLADAGDYTCVVSNACYEDVSEPATLIVIDNGPCLSLSNYSISEEVPDPEETFTIGYTCTNAGTADNSPDDEVICTATGLNASYVTVIDPAVSIGVLSPGSSVDITFDITTSSSLPDGSDIELTFSSPCGDYTVDIVKVITIGVDLTGYFTLDFEGLVDYSSDFSPWISYEGDGLNSWESSDCDFPGEGGAFGFMAFNPSDAGFGLASAHSGVRVGMAICPSDGATPADDWIISPKVPLAYNSSLSFWVLTAKPGSWGNESYNVLVSTTDDNPSSFGAIASNEESPADWTERTYDLSAYDNQDIHIGIQCVSMDKFMFWVDDISINTNSVPVEKIGDMGFFIIYPNPSTGMINIRTGNYGNDVIISVSDIYGKSVRRIKDPAFTNNTVYIDLSGVANGVYYINIITEDNNYTGMVTIIR